MMQVLEVGMTTIAAPHLSRHLIDDRAGVLQRVFARIDLELGEWRRRLRDRCALAAMSDRSLRDIGLTRYDAYFEARKPFWRE